MRWFTIRGASTRLFFLRDAQSAGFAMPVKGCVLANITGRGFAATAFVFEAGAILSNPAVSLAISLAA